MFARARRVIACLVSLSYCITFTANAGVGPKADPNAKIIIEGVKETLQTSHTEKSESLMWQAQSGNGVTEESLKLAQINAKSKFSAPGGIDVQLPAGDPLKTQVQELSKQPGMEWLNELSQRKDVNWQEVKLLKDSWQYEQEGLTQAGAIIVAIAVTIATADATGSAAASITGATEGAAYAATQAALSAAISQAAVTLANNKGDIGKTMQDMGKSENIKAIITSAVTAGALQYVNPNWMQELSKSGQFTDKAVINLTNAAVSATIKTAIMGGSYEDNLAASLKTAGIDTVAGWAASNIGQGYKNGDGALSDLQGQYIAHKVAHALVGCASAAAKDTSCAAGAIGGAVGEAFAEMYGQSKYGTADGATLTSTQQQEVLNMSKLVTAAVAGMSGKDAQAAVNAAQNAVINNWTFRELAFAVNNPKAALDIGEVDGSNNISSVAQRFASQGASPSPSDKEILSKTPDGLGDEVGAFRHALWQASITNKYGPAIAAEVGNAHEANPETVLSGQRLFNQAQQADQMVDLLNNQEGRNIGSTIGLTGKQLAVKTLDFYKNQGLWTATQNEQGSWVVQKSVIADDKYQQMLEAINKKDDYGRWLK